MYINEDLEAGKGLWGLFNLAHPPCNSGNGSLAMVGDLSSVIPQVESG